MIHAARPWTVYDRDISLTKTTLVVPLFVAMEMLSMFDEWDGSVGY